MVSCMYCTACTTAGPYDALVGHELVHWSRTDSGFHPFRKVKSHIVGINI
jgi:formate hydrogenlyase subunit 6/NADH:ubiquinone oxidoreductase subunit I